jgi:hypothetical protein
MDYGDEDFKLRLATEEEIQQVKKPKFEEDDWIVYDGWITQIVDVKHDGYVNSHHGFIPKDREDSMRLWDIKDAKPGDVLSWDHERYTIIFKELKDSKIIAHCSYNDHAKYFSTNSCAYDTIFDSNLRFTPASERAKKVLFEKIKEAGYEWDVKTKELKKIEKRKFKLGQRIKSDTREYTVYEICDGYYRLFDDECGAVSMHMLFKDEDKFELVEDNKTLTDFEDKLSAACLMFGASPEEDRTDYIKECAKTLMSIARKEIASEIDKYKMEEEFIDKAEERFKFDSYFYRCGIEDTLNIIEKK